MFQFFTWEQTNNISAFLPEMLRCYLKVIRTVSCYIKIPFDWKYFYCIPRYYHEIIDLSMSLQFNPRIMFKQNHADPDVLPRP